MMCYEAHPVSSIVDVLLTSRSEQRGRNQGSSPVKAKHHFHYFGPSLRDEQAHQNSFGLATENGARYARPVTGFTSKSCARR